MNCRACGFEYPPNLRFCGGCGASLAASNADASDAERRSVSVLFCDLVGSTSMSQRLDPEDMRELVDAYQRDCGDVVLGHGGYVAQYLGDCMVVYFGYPHAHEDDPARTVRCALDMLAAVRALGARTGRDLQVRIGAHCGRVVVGTVGGMARTERLAVGETPNIAARVQGEAAPGQIMISEALWRLLGGAFATESVGQRALKGVAQAVGLFRVLAVGQTGIEVDAPKTPYVGRTQERLQLDRLWTQAANGRPQVALLRGEPGIGKSRLLDLLRIKLAADGADVLMARCTPFTVDSALHPFIEMLNARLALDTLPPAERLARVVARLEALEIAPQEAAPLLASLMSLPIDAAQWPAPELSPVRARQRTLEILIETLFALARGRPLLFVVEDLHWADATTLELLRQLVASPVQVRLMALLTARPEFKSDWAAAGKVTEIELEALDPAAADALIRKAAHDKPLPPEVLWRIRERASGNPLFLEEITRAVTESGALLEGAAAWELVAPLATDVVPATMEASLMARMDRLGSARPLLQLAATLGREFSLELLQVVSQMPAESVADHLDKLLASGLVYPLLGGSARLYSFKHALVRDAAYDSLLRSTRLRFHERIAQALTAHFPDSVAHRPELLAHHLSGAGQYAQAAVHWRTAGERAAQRSAVNEAGAHLVRALGDLGELADDEARNDQELAILTVLAPVQMAVHGWASAEVAVSASRAIALAERLAANDRLYPPLWALWANQFVGGRLNEAMDNANRVLSMALATGIPMFEVTGRHATAYTRYYRGEYATALAEAEAGLALFDMAAERQICEIFQLSSSINLLVSKGSSLWMQGRQDEGIAVMDEMLALARSLRHPPSIAAALAFQMFFALYDRDWERLHAFADECHELSRAEGFSMWMANSGMHRGRARIGLGQVEAGVTEVLEWGALFLQTGSGINEGSTTSMACEAMHLAGRTEAALRVSAKGEQRALAGRVQVMAPEIFRSRAQILRELGRTAEATRELHQAVACARAQGALSLELRALNALLDLQLELGGPQATQDRVPAALADALSRMQCSADRPDLREARALLARALPARVTA